MHIYLYLTSILFLSSLFAYGNGPQPWAIYFGQLKIKQTPFSVHHEFQWRDYKGLKDHNQTLVRVGLQYRFSPLVQSTVGYGFIHTEAEGLPNNPFPEHRIYQEALLSHSLSSIGLRHRFRLEERFIKDKDLRGRIRYCLFADIPLTERGMSAKGWYASLYDEVFLNLSDQKELDAFDRNRAYLGAGYKVKDNLGLQLGYMRQHVGEFKGTDHLLFSIHKQLVWK